MKSFTSLSRLAVIATLLFSTNAFSLDAGALNKAKFEKLDARDQEQYLEIVDREVTEVYPRYDLVYSKLTNEKSSAGLGEVFMTVDKILALGQKIWKIVDAGKPVSSTKFTKPISIIPNMEDVNGTFSSMSHWRAPIVRSFKVAYRNGFGSEVISFVYTVVFQYGGKFEGKGSYITGLFVSASNVSVSWGFNFSASSEIMSIANQGSMDSPVASAVVNINYKASSVLKSIDETDIFYVNGDGLLQRMN
ncbi:hypothetical protein ACRXCV_08965 [Halobacteriovorax sp. GFR7]|uniref:hypothetical protein n=1 Tax=unclassified Halobacteriovorax TaxID=2639665 RepID=UPI003D98ECE6